MDVSPEDAVRQGVAEDRTGNAQDARVRKIGKESVETPASFVDHVCVGYGEVQNHMQTRYAFPLRELRRGACAVSCLCDTFTTHRVRPPYM